MRVQACDLCHTDPHRREGGSDDELPSDEVETAFTKMHHGEVLCSVVVL